MGALPLASIYVVVAIAWLLFSDVTLLTLGFSAEQVARYSFLKGTGFVGITGAALYALVSRFAARTVEREREYRDLFDSNPSPMWVYDLETLDFLAVNDAAVAKYGYSREEFLSMRISDIRPEEDVGRLLASVEAARDGAVGGIDRAGLWRHHTKQGALLWMEITSYITLFEGRRGELVLARDVTEAIEAREELLRYQQGLEALIAERTTELQDANARLTAATEAKSAFLATMSHELRTPLHSIIGFTSLLADGRSGPLDEEQRMQIGIVRDAGRHLLALINDVLDLSRIEAGRDEIELEPVEIAEMVSSVERTMAPLAVAKGLVWSAGGPADPDLEIVTDRRRLEQIITNLAGNAVKYTRTGTVDLTVTVGRGEARFSVTDTGPGIEPDQREAIFREFVRLEGDDLAPIEGTGLGLAISARLARLLGGRIEMESTPGEGSTFALVVPTGGPASDGLTV
ncbi:MAG: ATP-binding protein [Coriobacteriia bacterium]|nr:ATP-binding protein [Coriobacteriia bacterium]